MAARSLPGPRVRSGRDGAGRWIWFGAEPRPYHRYLYLRSSFDIPATTMSARLDITASDRYALWIDGRFVGRGPARSDPRRKIYDSWDVAKYLRVGASSVLAIRAYHYGSQSAPGFRPPYVGNGWTEGERAGVWAELRVATHDGELVYGTGPTWRCLEPDGWDRRAGLVNGWVGSVEIFDARLDPVDWQQPDFDDSAWQVASTIPNREHPWAVLHPRTTPHPLEAFVAPKRVCSVTEVVDLGHLPDQSPPVLEVPELLRQQIHGVLRHARVARVEDLVDARGPARLRAVLAGADGIRCPVVLLDMGRQVFGYPEVELVGNAGSVVDMTYGQALIEGRTVPGVRYGDRYTMRSGHQTWQVSEYRQFRYLEIAVRDPYADVTIERIGVRAVTYPAERVGDLSVSDPSITSLWRAAVTTVDLHIEDTLVCDAQRERVAWSAGDGAHGVHAIHAAYGDIAVLQHWLRSFLVTDRGDGLLKISYPPDETSQFNLPLMMAQWSARVRERLEYSSRMDDVRELYPSMRRQLDWFLPHIADDGLIRELPYGNWLDWSPVDIRGANLGTNALFITGLEDGSVVADALGEVEDARRWRSLAELVRVRADQAFWSEQDGAYRDSHQHGPPAGTLSELGNALALLAGIGSPGHRARTIRNLRAHDGRWVEVGVLYIGYVMDALFAEGAGDAAIALASTRFQPMLAIDEPTLWEGWSPFTGILPIVGDVDPDEASRVRGASYRSFVHSGGCLVAMVLSRRLLGVSPMAHAFRHCEVRPDPAGLSWARGAFPTPHGAIAVAWEKRDGVVDLTIDIPDDVDVDLILDRLAPSDGHRLVVDDVVRPSFRSDRAIRLGTGAHRVCVSSDASECAS